MPNRNALIVLAAVGAVLALLVWAARPGPTPAAEELINHHGHLTQRGDVYAYGVYVPARRRAGRALPLVVVLHGCGMTPAEMAAASGYSRLAQQDGFIVLYPDVDATDTSVGRCWRAIWDPSAERRGQGDAGAIATMTRRVISRWDGDLTRVYAIGISAGGFEASMLGADYPDLYAAIGIHSGAPYGGGGPGCAPQGAAPAGIPGLAQAARHAMGARARVMPVIVIHGSSDGRVPYACGRQAIAQWLDTDALVLGLGRSRTGMNARAARSVTSARVARGRAYTIVTYSGRSRCSVAQFWTIRGMGHFWSGGSAAPATLRFSDPRGPSASRASWAFFRHWRVRGTAGLCVLRTAR